MFGHRRVGWGRHAGAVFAAAFANSMVQALIAVIVAVATMSMTGRSLGSSPVTVIGIGAFTLWTSLFPVVLGEAAIVFTLGRAVLTLARRNFGAAYLALGLLLGVLEASIIGMLRGATTPRDMIFGAATGLITGFVYWLIAARDEEIVSEKARAGTSQVFA
jgi:hypothetical protein